MKRVSLFLMLLCIAVFAACNKDDGGRAKVKFRKAHIAGAEMLAIAQGGSAGTRAEGDVTVGPKALYTVSEDGSMVRVSYDVEVEGVNGEVAEFIQAHLIISPGFIFPVGDGWLWLANCWQQYDGDWESLPKSPERSALSKIQNDFRATYNERHGAHYLIRKSDGALFEWTLEAGAPNGMDDGFKQPTFLNGWFHEFGKDLFVRPSGWMPDGMSDPELPSLVRLQDKGSTLDAVDLLGKEIGCNTIFPATGCIGAELYYPGADGSSLGILAPAAFKPVLVPEDGSEGKNDLFFLSIGGTLYLGVVEDASVTWTDGKEGYQYTQEASRTKIYNLVISGNSVTKGSLICSFDDRMFWGGERFISTTDKLDWWTGNDYDGVKIHTLDPKTGTITTRNLPDHYPSLRDSYVDRVAYVADGTAGYWECDLRKDAAEYVAFDWSSANQYQGQIVQKTLKMDRFEAASMTFQFTASLTDGTRLSLNASVLGADKGKIKTTIASENNAGMVVTTMVRLN